MKRSHAVVAVLAAATVGGTAYSMMPSERCARSDGGAAIDPASPACRSGSGGSSSGYHGSRSFFSSSGGSGSGGAASTGPSSTSGGTTRGGFGGFFSSLGSHIGGG
jgi:hypothetical protein